MSESEETILARLKVGDKSAFDVLYYKYAPQLMGFCRSYMLTSEDAEEIVEDVFISLWLNRQSLRNTSTVKPFLFVSTRNLILKKIRSRINSPIYEEYVSVNSARFASEEPRPMEYDEFERLVMDIVNSLPQTQKSVIILSRFEHRSNKEIAERLQLSQQTVKNALVQGLKYLRDKLSTKTGYTLILLIASLIIS